MRNGSALARSALVAGLLAAVSLSIAAPGPAAAQSPRDQSPRDRLVVDAAWLAGHLDDPALVLLHVGDAEAYAAEHLPGARHLELGHVAAPEDHEGGTALSLELPDPATLEARLEALGIGDGSRVVVYWGENQVTPVTRVVYTLDWIGLGDRTSILDGGMPAWKEAGHPVTAETPAPARGDLTPRPDAGLVVTADWVESHLETPGYRIVDARAPVHYDGIQATYLHRKEVRKGHIPGAANIPVSSFLDDAHRLRPDAELRRLFQDAGVEPGDTVVGYCHLGQFATLLLFSARTLGYDVKLYDGSFQEWGSQQRRSVALPGS